MTVIENEIKDRVEYFEDWMRKLSTDAEKSMVVNEKTAIEFIKASLSNDSSLSRLVDEMEQQPSSFKQFTNGSYIQSLIDANRSGQKLDKAVASLKKRRESLEKALPSKTSKDKELRRAVVKKYLDDRPDLVKKYNIRPIRNKNGVIQYHDSKGRFAKQDKLLIITDKVVLTTKKAVDDYDVWIAEWKKRNNY